jgi:hypothetical protein
MILGPYTSAGKLWQPCDVDACNGVTIDGKYYYVLSNFYPYTIGCWGPANPTSYALSCTTNERVCSSRMLSEGANNLEEDLFTSSAFKMHSNLQVANLFNGLLLFLSYMFLCK